MVLERRVTARAADPYRDLAVIDSRAPRFNQAVVGVVSLLAVATGWWWLLALLALQLALGSTLGRRCCLPCLAYFELVQPRLRRGAARGLPAAAGREHGRLRRAHAASVAYAGACGARRRRSGSRSALLVAVLALLAAPPASAPVCEAYKLGCRLSGRPFVSCPLPARPARRSPVRRTPTAAARAGLSPPGRGGGDLAVLAGRAPRRRPRRDDRHGRRQPDDADPDPLFGFDAKVAVGTDILHGAVFKSFGAARHRMLGTVHARLALWMLVGSAPLSLVGVAVANRVGDNDMSTLPEDRRRRADSRRRRLPGQDLHQGESDDSPFHLSTGTRRSRSRSARSAASSSG